MFRIFKRKVSAQNYEANNGKRLVIIHNHLFKNAGSTIDWALKHNFANGFVDHRDNDSMKRGADYLGQYIDLHPSLCALSTHQLRLPLPKMDNVDFLLLTMFRHPLRRVVSVYYYERRQIGVSTPGAEYARNHSLKEYVEWRLRSDVPPSVRNFHVRKTLPRRRPARQALAEEDLLRAKEALKSMPLSGVVERFDESMAVFEDRLKVHFPEIDLSYLPQNISSRPSSSEEDEIALLQRELGESLFSELVEENQMDLDLYECAVSKLESSVNSMLDFPNYMEGFQNRCLNHQPYWLKKKNEMHSWRNTLGEKH